MPGLASPLALFRRRPILSSALALSLLIALLALIARWWIATDGGRDFVVSQIDGRQVAGYGRLSIRNLEGDPLSDFSVGSLEIRDDTGPWISATNIKVQWSPLALLSRRVDLNSVAIDQVAMARRPTREERPESEGSNWAVHLGRGTVARLHLAEGFAGPESASSVSARFINERSGRLETEFSLTPLEGAGDRIDSSIVRKRNGSFDVRISGTAPAGGTFAHLLALPEGSSATLSASGAGDLADGLGEAVFAIDGSDKLFLSGKIESRQIEASLRMDAEALPLPASLGGFLGQKTEAELTAEIGKQTTLFALTTRFDAGTATLTGNLDSRKLNLVGPANLQADLSTLQPYWNGARQIRLDGTLAQADGTFHYNGQSLLVADEASALPFTQASGLLEVTLGGSSIPFRIDAAVQNPLQRNATIARAIGETARVTGNGTYDITSRRVLINTADISHASGTAQILGEASLSEKILDFSGRASQALSAFPGGMSGNATGFVQAKGPFDNLEVGLNLNLTNLGTSVEALMPLVEGAGSARGILRLTPDQGRIDRIDLRLRGFEGRVTGAIYGPAAPNIGVVGNQRVPLDIAGNTIDLSEIDIQLMPTEEGLRITGSTRNGDAIVSGRSVEALSSTINLEIAGGSITGPVRLSGQSDGQPASASFFLNRQPGSTRLEDLKGKLAGIAVAGAAAFSDDGEMDLDVDAQATDFRIAGVSLGAVTFKGTGVRQVDSPFSIGGEFRARNIALTPEFLLDSVSGTIETTPQGYRFSGRIEDTEDRLRSNVAFNGTLRQSESGTSGTIALDGSLFGIAVASRKDISWSVQPALSVDADLSVLGGRVTARLQPNRQSGSDLLELNQLSIRPVLVAFGYPEIDTTVSGRIAGRLFGEAPNGTIALTARSPVSGLDTSVDLKVDGTINRKDIQLAGTMAYGPDLKASANLTAPVRTAPGQLVLPARSSPLNGQLNAGGKLDALHLLAMAYGHDIAGDIASNFDISGTMDAPRLKGRATISNGKYEYGALGLRLSSMDIDAGIDGPTLDVKGSAAGPGGGKLTFNGRLAENEAGVSAEMTRLLIYDKAGDYARVSGNAKLAELADHRLLDGKLTIEQARFAIDNLSGSSIRTLNVRWAQDGADAAREPILEKPIRLNLGVSANRGIAFHGRGLETDWGVNLQLTGTPDNVLLNGKATLARGSLELARRPFEFERGTISFDGPVDSARMSIAADREVDGFSVRVEVTGSPSQPAIQLSSNPALPEDEILSRMLFGRSSVDLSALEAAELASSIARLTGNGSGFDPVGVLQAGLGVDRLRLGVDEAGNTELGVGQYLAPDVYLEVSTQGAAGNSVEVEWQPRPQVSVTSETNSTGESRVSVRWKRDY